jgi:hypothetical protein
MIHPTRVATLLTLGAAAVLAAAGAGYCAGRALTRTSQRVDSVPVVEAIRKVARLATVEMQVADVVRYEEVRTVLVWDIPKNATLRLHGRVQGGFDLMKGFDVVADDATKTLRIELPAPQILSVDDRLEWFDETSNLMNPITPADRTRWTTWARGALARAAKDAGLFDKATTHARELLTSAASAFGWKADVKIGLAIGPSP